MRIIALLSFVFLIVPGYAQNARNLHYLIKKSAIESGELKINFRDKNDSLQPIKMCYEKMKAEDLSIKNGFVVFHFEKVNSSRYDSVPGCISNNTPFTYFEIDVSKKKIGDDYIVAKVPFHTLMWGVSIIPFRARFGQDTIPLSSEAKIDFTFTYGFATGFARIDQDRITHYYISTSPFLGATSANLKKQNVKNPTQLLHDQSNVAITYGLNLMLGVNNFGVSFSLGFDHALGKNASNWIYQNKPWIGIGLSSNLGLFK